MEGEINGEEAGKAKGILKGAKRKKTITRAFC
jgi:hypothetical protein